MPNFDSKDIVIAANVLVLKIFLFYQTGVAVMGAKSPTKIS